LQTKGSKKSHEDENKKGFFKGNPRDLGPDLKKFKKLSFSARGSGGIVKFFIECDDAPQAVKFVTLSNEWTQVTLNIEDSWKYCNIPFGWACNESNPDKTGGTIEFWVDNLRFE